MLVLTARVYGPGQKHPDLVLLFLGCAAGFYIICYNALSVSDLLRSHLERQFSATVNFSIAMAVVLSAIPVSSFYVLQVLEKQKPISEQNGNPSAGGVLGAAPGSTARTFENNSSDRGLFLKEIRSSSSATSTTVTIEMNAKADYEVRRLYGPDRIYLDFRESKFDAVLMGGTLEIKDSRLRKIRIAEHDSVTRVTLVTKGYCDYSVTNAPDSPGLRIELRNSKSAGQ